MKPVLRYENLPVKCRQKWLIVIAFVENEQPFKYNVFGNTCVLILLHVCFNKMDSCNKSFSVAGC
jgi:hypothetical protein